MKYLSLVFFLSLAFVVGYWTKKENWLNKIRG